MLSCHGTVENLDDLPAFLSNIRRGRPTPPALIEEVRRRFEAIGGSPLLRITGEQADLLARATGLRVAFAGRLWHPYPADVLRALVAEGVTRVISLPLAPQSVHVYHAAVREAAEEVGSVDLVEVPCWGETPALLEGFFEAIEETLAKVPEDRRARAAVVLTAHSLPIRVIEGGDPYERDFRAMAAHVALRYVHQGRAVRVAFQSQGASNEAWLGPDLFGTIETLATEGASDVVVAPIGFIAEHVETLYDLDIEAKAFAESKNVAFHRAPAMSTRPKLIAALASLVAAATKAG